MSDCQHEWIANSGQGGEPIFRGVNPMHVLCGLCNCRTWMYKKEWEKARKPAPTK